MIFYPNETQGHELINGQNSLVPEDNPDWRLVLDSTRTVTLPPTINLRESLISTNQHRLIWQFNWINGQFETNDTKAKLMAVKNRLLGNGNHSVAVIISTHTGEDTAEARQRLTNFLQTMSPTILKVIKQFNTIVTTP
jgi:EpsI family protein